MSLGFKCEIFKAIELDRSAREWQKKMILQIELNTEE